MAFMLYFYVNVVSMIDVICMIKLMTRYREMWIEEMMRGRTNEQNVDESLYKMFDIYKELIESYQSFQKLFQGMVIMVIIIFIIY